MKAKKKYGYRSKSLRIFEEIILRLFCYSFLTFLIQIYTKEKYSRRKLVLNELNTFLTKNIPVSSGGGKEIERRVESARVR